MGRRQRGDGFINLGVIELEDRADAKVGTASIIMRISIDCTANYIQLWGKIYTAHSKTDGGDVGGESSGEIRWALFVERPQISLLLQNA